VLLLVPGSPQTLERHVCEELGRLVLPGWCDRIEDSAPQYPWAADNGAFGDFDEHAFWKMVYRLEGLPGCLFLTVPDVVADSVATRSLWGTWQPLLTGLGFTLAYVLQDGQQSEDVPWDEAGAVFIGGSTEWKLGEDAWALAREARSRGKHVHMGRVNSVHRLRFAALFGCDSVDGSNWIRRLHRLPEGLDAARRFAAVMT
jgi:hypothetical protein